MVMNRVSNNQGFQVTDEEITDMIDTLSQNFEREEVQKLSKAWIREIMIQPNSKKKSQRRTFAYSKKKLIQYLTWRRKSTISSKILHHLTNSSSNSSGDDDISKLASGGPGGLYWFGTDKDSSPILWYHANVSDFGKMNVKDEMEFTALIITAALDVMPHDTFGLNFVILLDKFNPLDVAKKPTLLPTFVKTMMKICPDRLKKAYLVVGGVGQFFYDMTKGLVPSNIIDKVDVSKTRQDSTKKLVSDGVLSMDHVPIFMGGEFIHNDEITKNFSTMIETIKQQMNDSNSVK